MVPDDYMAQFQHVTEHGRTRTGLDAIPFLRWAKFFGKNALINRNSLLKIIVLFMVVILNPLFLV